MITCIGTGGHARALELPAGTLYVDATAEEILAGKVRGDRIVVGVGYAYRGGWATREAIVNALKTYNRNVGFPSWSVFHKETRNDGHGRQLFRSIHLGPNVELGEHVIINTGAIIEHDCVIEDFAHVAPGAVVCGGVRIGKGALIGAGSVVLPNAVIEPGELVKAGSVRK